MAKDTCTVLSFKKITFIMTFYFSRKSSMNSVGLMGKSPYKKWLLLIHLNWVRRELQTSILLATAFKDPMLKVSKQQEVSLWLSAPLIHNDHTTHEVSAFLFQMSHQCYTFSFISLWQIMWLYIYTHIYNYANMSKQENVYTRYSDTTR